MTTCLLLPSPRPLNALACEVPPTVPTFFPPAGCCEDNSIALCGPLVRRTITVHGAHERRALLRAGTLHRGANHQPPLPIVCCLWQPLANRPDLRPANPRHCTLQCIRCQWRGHTGNCGRTKGNTEQMRLNRGELSRKTSSVRDAASCCQPILIRGSDCLPRMRFSHLLMFFWPQQLPSDKDLRRLAPEQPRTGKPLPCDEHEHGQRICPAGPECGCPCAHCASQSNPSQNQRHGCCVSRRQNLD